ncbi:MAG: DUF262 domain-containing protein [Treponema sp.]|jgi:uncharacterized protein with ParB-like and HNH nuclease domain|nr:DUF262 domain-containing protein [Treponema sp.]
MANGTSLTINKKSIAVLFRDIKNHKYIIPDYQRPYAWGLDHCEAMWNDIVDNSESPNEYFFGTIVTFKNSKDNLEVIDGQQRLTSFFLLLRALYKKLENSDQNSRNVIGLKNQIAPCIWDTDEITQEITDYSLIHIESKVATESEIEIFHKILKTGDYDEEARDKYSTNYRYFTEQSDEYAKNFPMKWEKLCIFILNRCIVLPIECDAEDTALTIFSTLNDRGEPLSDSDIFKAKMYRSYKTKKEQQIFTKTWNELTETSNVVGIGVDGIFRYYMHVIRARENNNKREIGLRRFYADRQYAYLKTKNILQELISLANFWWYVVYREDSSSEGYIIPEEAMKWLHCLTCYPNEYWKYPVNVFFLKNNSSKDFSVNLCSLLKKEIAFLFGKFIITPTINAIRDDIYNAYISIDKKNDPKFKPDFTIDNVNQRLQEYTSPRLAKALLLLDAYLNKKQKSLIIENFQIEHIFPKKWQNTNYNGLNEEEAEEYFELYGNKVVFEQKLNIQAGNGYFGKKKEKYEKSEIANVIELSKLKQNDWVKSDIEKRENRFCHTIIDFIKNELFD